jgi:glycosyltransferase involved in cell wall biosynthesis
VHDAYNVKLAVQYGEVADAFICHSRFYYEVMLQLFPWRRKDIFHIPYGIPVPPNLPEKMETSKIKLVFLGRHDQMKGIFDLIEIEKILASQGILTDWLIFGRGPETATLKEQWKGFPNVTFLSPESNAEVLRMLGERDILVFPTKFEGFPVALLEAMGTGCVPVASELPGGLRELVRDGVNGYLCEMDNNPAFAERIALLYRDRDLLSLLSRNARADVVSGYNVLLQSPKYQDLFKTLAGSEGKPIHHTVKKKLGSRLDQPWLPNSIVKILRKTI